jgi:hypothetical protein
MVTIPPEYGHGVPGTRTCIIGLRSRAAVALGAIAVDIHHSLQRQKLTARPPQLR